MDQNPLVDVRIEDGRRLLAELTGDSFEISVAFWTLTQEHEPWEFYIVLAKLGSPSLVEAIRAVYSALLRCPSQSIALSEVRVVEPTNPLAKNVASLRDRFPASLPTRCSGRAIGDPTIHEIYIYPRMMGLMGRREVLEAVVGLMDRNDSPTPSVITLKDGTRFEAIPVGMEVPTPGDLRIVLHDALSKANRSISADEVATIH